MKLERDLVTADLETTGLKPAEDRIIEVALSKRVNGKQVYWSKVVNPECFIPREVSAVHGIYNDEVAGAPLFSEVAWEIAEFIKGCDVAGFCSATFDLPFLRAEFERCGTEFPEIGTSLDVCQLFRWKEPFHQRHTLQAAHLFYLGRTVEGAHRALNDVKATRQILSAMVDRYGWTETPAELMHLATKDCIDPKGNLRRIDGETFVCFGVHSGKRLSEVRELAPDYLVWMQNNLGEDISNEVRKVFGATSVG